MTELLFVYGTLRRGHGNPFARLLADSAWFEGVGTVRGTLYRVATYPGWVEEGSGRVAGELFSLDAESDVLRRLDEYEGPEYERVECEVTRPDRSVARAWIYRYCGSLEGKPRIESGNWMTVTP